MSHAIVVDDLQFSWPDGATLFDGLSFTVGPGRTALIGVNGSGKSTLLRLIAGELSGLARRVGEVSGGEAILLGLAAQFLRRPDVLLLDEPTNNLDLDARRRRCPAPAAGAARGPHQAGPARPLRAEDVGHQARAQDHHGGAQAAGRGRGGQAPGHAHREAGAGPGPADRGHRGGPRRRRDPGRPARHRRAGRPHRPDRPRRLAAGRGLGGPRAPGAGTRRPARRQRRRQDDPARDDHGRGGPAGRVGDRGRPGAVPAPAPAPAGRPGIGRGQRGPVRPRRLRQRRPGPPGQIPVPRPAGRPAGGQPVRRRAVPRHPGRPAAGRAAAPAAAPGRADQQRRPGQHPPACPGTGRLPGRAAGGQPRPGVLRGAGITRWLRLEGRLVSVDPP